MIVLKLGGSLLSQPLLFNWLQWANEHPQQVVIVAGGGVFADQVRLMQKQWHYNDRIAHEMAILAMQQTALLFHGIYPDLKILDSIDAISQQPQTVIWSPLIAELDQDNVPASWDVTSDSLAAWLAGKLNADKLILVKSAEISPHWDIETLIAKGIIDKAFLRFYQPTLFELKCVRYNDVSVIY